MSPQRRAKRRGATPGSPVILDAGALIALVEGSPKLTAFLTVLRRADYRVVIPAVVLVEVLTGKHTDAAVNRVIAQAAEVPPSDEGRCRFAATLRAATLGASPIDALVIAEAAAVPAGLDPIVLTFDPDLAALASNVKRRIAVPDLHNV